MATYLVWNRDQWSFSNPNSYSNFSSWQENLPILPELLTCVNLRLRLGDGEKFMILGALSLARVSSSVHYLNSVLAIRFFVEGRVWITVAPTLSHHMLGEYGPHGETFSPATRGLIHFRFSVPCLHWSTHFYNIDCNADLERGWC